MNEGAVEGGGDATPKTSSPEGFDQMAFWGQWGMGIQTFANLRA